MSSNTYLDYILSWFWKPDDKVIDNESNKLFNFPAGYSEGVIAAMIARNYSRNTSSKDDKSE